VAEQPKSKVELTAEQPRTAAAQKENDAAVPAPAATATVEDKTAEKPRTDIKESQEAKTAARSAPDEVDEKPMRPRDRKATERREKDRTAEQARLQREFEAAERHERFEKRRLAERRANERRRAYDPEPAVRYYRAGAPEPRRGGARFTDIWTD
jgi:hypothetical protein